MADEDTTTLEDLQNHVRERAAAYLTVYSETEGPDALAGDRSRTKRVLAKGRAGGRLKKPARTHAVQYDSLLDEQRSETEHVAALAERLRPYADQIRDLCVDDTTWAIVRVVEHASSSAMDLVTAAVSHTTET